MAVRSCRAIRGEDDPSAVFVKIRVCFQSSDHVLLGVRLLSKFKPDIQEFERVHVKGFGDPIEVAALELLGPARLDFVDGAPADARPPRQIGLREP